MQELRQELKQKLCQKLSRLGSARMISRNMMTKSNVRILEAVTLALIWMEGRMMAKLMEQIMAKCIVTIIAQKCYANILLRLLFFAVNAVI